MVDFTDLGFQRHGWTCSSTWLWCRSPPSSCWPCGSRCSFWGVCRRPTASPTGRTTEASSQASCSSCPCGCASVGRASGGAPTAIHRTRRPCPAGRACRGSRAAAEPHAPRPRLAGRPRRADGYRSAAARRTARTLSALGGWVPRKTLPGSGMRKKNSAPRNGSYPACAVISVPNRSASSSNAFA